MAVDGKKRVRPTSTVGYAGTNTRYGQIKADEKLNQLRGVQGVTQYREMRDNDATVGAALYAIEQTLRDVDYKVIPVDDTQAAVDAAEFVEDVFDDMKYSLDDHISQALSSLTFGWFDSEVIYKRRSDGRIGVHKLAPRAQWTINRFDVDEVSGDLKGIYQNQGHNGYTGYIPANKLVHYTTTNVNGDYSGRSILRNAYKSYEYLKTMQEYEAISVERNLHGVPKGKMPAEYLAESATDDQKAVMNDFLTAIKDLKNNEQGAIIVPSDPYYNDDGKASNMPLMDVELMTVQGTGGIDVDKIIRRYQHDIARTLLAEFVMLGSSAGGSYALSKTKGDMFLRSLESYLNTIYDCLQRQLLPRLFELNGISSDLIPTLKPNDVVPHDLRELGAFLRNINGAGIALTNQSDTLEAIFEAAELPFDTGIENSSAEIQHGRDMALAEEQSDVVDDQNAVDEDEDE